MELSRAVGSLPSVPETTASTPESLQTHNDTDRQDTATADGFSQAAVHRGVICMLRSILAVVTLGLLIRAAIEFGGTWARQCDYDLKIWVLVTLARLLVQLAVFPTVSHYCRLSRLAPYAWYIDVLSVLSNIFALCWFLYGIKPILVDTWCDSNSHLWAGSLWYVGCIPCLVYCVFCYPIVVVHDIFTRPHESAPPRAPLPASPPAPPDTVAMLEVTTFRDIKHLLRPNRRVEPQTNEGAGLSQRAPGIQSERSQIGFLMMDPFTQYRRIQNTLMGTATNGHRPDAETIGRQRRQSRGPSCPICCCDFDDDEELLVMPCNKRHAFHKECATGWLANCRLCPMCRADVVETLKQKSNDGKNRATKNRITSIFGSAMSNFVGGVLKT